MTTRIAGTEILEHQAHFPEYSTEFYMEGKYTHRLKAELLLRRRKDRSKAAEVCTGCLFNNATEGFPERTLVCGGVTTENHIAKIDFEIGDLEETEGRTLSRIQRQATSLSSCGLRGFQALTAFER